MLVVVLVVAVVVDVLGCLNFGRNPLAGYNGYYRPAMRIQSLLLLSLLLYQIPVNEIKKKLF